MKAYKIIILSVLSVFLLLPYACTEILEESDLNQAPEQELDFEKVFTDYQQYRQFLDYTYLYMPGHLGRLWNSMVAELSDEAEGLGVNTCSPVFNNGAWSGAVIPSGTPVSNANRELSELWTNLYKGIRQANMAMQNIDKVKNFPDSAIYRRSLGETHFLGGYL